MFESLLVLLAKLETSNYTEEAKKGVIEDVTYPLDSIASYGMLIYFHHIPEFSFNT
jgi:hypothetical protein